MVSAGMGERLSRSMILEMLGVVVGVGVFLDFFGSRDGDGEGSLPLAIAKFLSSTRS